MRKGQNKIGVPAESITVGTFPETTTKISYPTSDLPLQGMIRNEVIGDNHRILQVKLEFY